MNNPWDERGVKIQNNPTLIDWYKREQRKILPGFQDPVIISYNKYK